MILVDTIKKIHAMRIFQTSTGSWGICGPRYLTELNTMLKQISYTNNVYFFLYLTTTARHIPLTENIPMHFNVTLNCIIVTW